MEAIKVGDWVWVWRWQEWRKIVGLEHKYDVGGGCLLSFDDHSSARETDCTKNPVIPPKPKHMVTREAELSRFYEVKVASDKVDGSVVPILFDVPGDATNIKCTYEIRED